MKQTNLITLLIAIITLSGFSTINSQKEGKEINYKKVEAEVKIAVPPSQVWSLIGENFDQNSRFNVDAKKTYYLQEDPNMIGAQRRTVNYKDKVIDVEIVEYDPSKQHVKWVIFNMNAAPLKAGYSSYSLRDDGNGGTILTQKAGFKMKVFLMNGIAKGKFTNLFKTELAAIKHLAETGENITEQNKDDIVERYANSITIK